MCGLSLSRFSPYSKGSPGSPASSLVKVDFSMGKWVILVWYGKTFSPPPPVDSFARSHSVRMNWRDRLIKRQGPSISVFFFNHSWSPLGWCKTIIFISNVILFLLVGRKFSLAVFQHLFFFIFLTPLAANISRTGLFLGIHLGPAWNFTVLTCSGLNSILVFFLAQLSFKRKAKILTIISKNNNQS